MMAPKTRRQARLEHDRDKTNNIDDELCNLRNANGADMARLILWSQIDAETTFSDYVKNLLFYGLTILAVELREQRQPSREDCDRRSVWRNFGMLDQLEIPPKALDYIAKIYPLDEQPSSGSNNAKRSNSFYDQSACSYFNAIKPGSNVRLIRSQRLILETVGSSKWFRAGQYSDEKEMEEEQRRGVNELERHIAKRLECGQDVRSLSQKDLKDLNEAFPTILNAIRDPKGDFMTLNSALLLQGAWDLAFETYCDIEGPLDHSQTGLSRRRELWMKAAVEKKFGLRFYADRIRIGEKESQIHHFCTTFKTTDEVRTILNHETADKVRTVLTDENQRKRKKPLNATSVQAKRANLGRRNEPDVQPSVQTIRPDVASSNHPPFEPFNVQTRVPLTPGSDTGTDADNETQEPLSDSYLRLHNPINRPNDRQEQVTQGHSQEQESRDDLLNCLIILTTRIMASEGHKNLGDTKHQHDLDGIFETLRTIAEDSRHAVLRALPSIVYDQSEKNAKQQKCINDIVLGWNDLSYIFGIRNTLNAQELKMLKDTEKCMRRILGSSEHDLAFSQ